MRAGPDHLAKTAPERARSTRTRSTAHAHGKTGARARLRRNEPPKGRRAGAGGMIGGVCRRGPRPGWVGQGDHVIVCAFGVEDRVLVGGEVRYTREWSRMCELARGL